MGTITERNKQLEDVLKQTGPQPAATKPAQASEPSNIEEIRARIRKMKDRKGAGGAPFTPEEQTFYDDWKDK